LTKWGLARKKMEGKRRKMKGFKCLRKAETP